MSLANWICGVLIVSGVILFLYGANFYVSTVGWVGLYIFLLGVVSLVALYVYGELAKKDTQNP